LRRSHHDRAAGEGGRLTPRALGNLVDVLFALTSFAFFSQLAAGKRSAAAACTMIQEIAIDAVKRALQQSAK
jgi:hypothetical protein